MDEAFLTLFNALVDDDETDGPDGGTVYPVHDTIPGPGVGGAPGYKEIVCAIPEIVVKCLVAAAMNWLTIISVLSVGLIGFCGAHIPGT